MLQGDHQVDITGTNSVSFCWLTKQQICSIGLHVRGSLNVESDDPSFYS